MAGALKDYERVWLEKVRARFASDEPLDYSEMMVALRDKLPAGFTPDMIDPEYLRGSQTTVAGLHALNPHAQELKDVERLLFKIKEWKIEGPRRQEVSAEECARALTMSEIYVARLLALAGTLDFFWSGTSPNSDNTGFSRVIVSSLANLAAFLAFTSIENALRERARKGQQPASPSSWGTSTFPQLTDFANESAEADNTPLNAEERVQIKRVIEEIRIYITTTSTLGAEPLAKINRKLDYLIDASERVGRKDLKVLFLGILCTFVYEGLIPSGPDLRELFGIAGHLLRQVLGGGMSPPLLH